MEMIQGETGTQSRDDGAGALRGGAWTPEKQSKFLLRHMMSHLFLDTKFTSYFSCMDMIEALNGTVGDKSSYLDYGYFGLLGAEFDSDGFATGEYKQKLAYRSYQVLASIFREEFWLEDLPLRFIDGVFSRRLLRNDDINRKIIARSFKKPNGSSALVYWMPSELLTTSYESTLSLECAGIYEKIHLIDLKNGDVFDVPDDLIIRKENGYLQLLHLPLKDYPMLLTFGDFSEYELKTIKTKNT